MEGETVVINSQSYLSMIWQAIASVGWYIVGGLVLFISIYPYLEEKYNNWRQKKDEEEYSAKYHKDPDVFEERARAVEAARQRLQQKYFEQAERAKQQEEERKKLKQEELKKLLNGTEGGNKLGTGPSPGSSHLRDEYNPLMGQSSRGYRAPKRTCCGKKCG